MNFDKELGKCNTMDDLIGKNGLLQRLVGGMVEKILEKEMDEHLGYEKNSVKGNNTGNSRNGVNKKTVQSSYGPVDIEVPRDREGSFEPRLIKKRQRQIGSFDEKIISMYGKGMTTRDIQDHIKDLYGADISPTMISTITDQVVEVAEEWRSRPLSKVYPVIFFDAIHYKVKDGNKVVTKAAYTCLGINLEGKKEILGAWIGESEGAKVWLQVFTELKNRGVEDIFIACMDGLKGLPEALKSVFPLTEVQLCIIHMIRNSLKFVPHKYSKEFVKDLKDIYQASTESKAESAVCTLDEKWNKRYPLAVKPWMNHWENLKTFFKFPEEIKRLIYTTNAVESLHRQFRKVTKTRAVFPSDKALLKMLYLASRDVSKKWTLPVRGWKEALSYFGVAYEERLPTLGGI
ncbi:IS256 family transposase [Candidatus Neptunochlamydia vexilliferae]|uniref:Mutator family transposase n=1 Tax=Candidatus Neptunichlamydia vexilliferae TaxID=1651774 RepID=A0ABS0B046_9BACT|nr:IS256 family transposase [Candidatus Neptunochlamydia vexilliferae]MBF5059091.1 putative transposase for insertion sequence element ISRM3-like [Candidatus Neptunochlamydia vexilliferae]